VTIGRAPGDPLGARSHMLLRVELPQGPHVVTGLVAARAAADRRYALGGARLAVHHLAGPSEQRELGPPREVREVLERDLLVDTSGLPDLDEHPARLSPAGPTGA
jgi:arylamine N-acetyltransferase